MANIINFGVKDVEEESSIVPGFTVPSGFNLFTTFDNVTSSYDLTRSIDYIPGAIILCYNVRATSGSQNFSISGIISISGLSSGQTQKMASICFPISGYFTQNQKIYYLPNTVQSTTSTLSVELSGGSAAVINAQLRIQPYIVSNCSATIYVLTSVY